MKNIYAKIIGTGSFLPELIIKNKDFLDNIFLDRDGQPWLDEEKNPLSNEKIIEKFKFITDIDERRYAPNPMLTSDMAYEAAFDAIISSGIDPESLNAIFVAHNFGDVSFTNKRSVLVPGMASKVKFLLGIKNPSTSTTDVILGCPGWLHAMHLADIEIRAGAKRVMVIGAEMLSRVSDPHDRDSMIYSDGAGAVILERTIGNEFMGILNYAIRSDTIGHVNLLKMGPSNNPNYQGDDQFLKMDGNLLFRYAMDHVPQAIKDCMDKSNISFNQVAKFLFHQANAKMDWGFLGRLAELYGYRKEELPLELMPKKKDYGIIGKVIVSHGIRDIPPGIMPMTIHKLGNSSVATIPTMLDLLFKNKLEGHKINPGDNAVFASVGAGMNINAMTYRF
jgi:3-oxoacyl-[acyl-carrier-protein] synthase-3